MAASGPTVPNTISNPTPELPFIKFPPFPEPPPGVKIMPFRDFKPRGIQLFSEPKRSRDGSGDEDDAELDALGIPTVELRVKHATDVCKSNPRKKRKKKKAANASVEAVPVKKLPWYEEWEEGEDLRVTRVRYDTSVSAVDRFFQSAYDFRTGRPWPPVSSGLGNLWDQFRLFTGLLINPSVVRKTGGKKTVRAESPDFDSDDEDDLAMNVDIAPTTNNGRYNKRRRPDGGLDSDEDGRIYDPHKSDEELRDEKITIFLNDPEKSVRIFLSAYMREHGLIWSERHLIHAPRLVYFFLAFVLRNRVLQEPTYQRGLKRALEMIEGAKKELPLTDKVGKSIPDAINEACRECFGRQGGVNWSYVSATATTTTVTATAGQDCITLTDMSNGVETKIVLPTEAEMHLKDAIEDNIDAEVSLATPVVAPANSAAGDNGWGSGDGWDNGCENKTPWDQNAWDKAEPWVDEENEGWTNPAVEKWTDSKPTWSREPVSLVSLLGPTVFPLTHTTGIVECSTRRIVSVQFPPNHPNGISPPALQKSLREMSAGVSAGWSPSACGVEEELDTRFAKVVLEPWGREEGDISGPEIWASSRGPVIDPSKKVPTKPADVVTRKPHNPLTDNITLLVEPSFAETLAMVPGLGLGAMWIEIARQKSGRGTDGAAEVDIGIPGRFWYHEDVTGIFPSFYTPREKDY